MPLQLSAVLNSTPAQMAINLSDRDNLSSGPLKLELHEFSDLRIVNRWLLPELVPSGFNATDWGAQAPSSARQQIDDAVFDGLGLVKGERGAVYADVSDLVHQTGEFGTTNGRPIHDTRIQYSSCVL